MKNKFLFTILFTFYFLLFTSSASAAVSVFLDPPNISVNPRDTFTVNIRIDTGGDCVNAIDAKVKFDPSVLKAVDFGRGQSLISLWLAPPKIDQSAGIISFAGGIPGGYCGRVSGDPGLTNILGKIIFTPTSDVPGTTRADIMNDSEILLNDGLGTKAEAEYKGANVAIGNGTETKNDWLAEMRADTIAPELFTIELVRDPNAYDGRYFIAWSTTDKQSGIDHYEVLETDPWKFGFFNFFNGERRTFWARAESPYVLLDQNLRSKIMVKAVDKIGNEQIAELEPETAILKKVEVDRMWVFVTVLLSFLAFVITAWRMRKTKNEKLKVKNDI